MGHVMNSNKDTQSGIRPLFRSLKFWLAVLAFAFGLSVILLACLIAYELVREVPEPDLIRRLADSNPLQSPIERISHPHATTAGKPGAQSQTTGVESYPSQTRSADSDNPTSDTFPHALFLWEAPESGICCPP